MRIPILVAAAVLLTLGGCSQAIDRSVDKASEHAAAPGEGWTMQIVGDESESQVVLVSGPNGKSAAARIAGGVSTLIGDAEAQGLMTETQAALAETAPPQKVAISAPGVSIKVAADDADSEGGRGRVAINVGGISVNVDGDDADGKGRGTFRIAGVDDEAAAKFIDGLEDLSPEVKAQMRAKLGL